MRILGPRLLRELCCGRKRLIFAPAELLHEPLRRARISSALDHDVEHEAILVDSAPEPMMFAGIEIRTSSRCLLWLRTELANPIGVDNASTLDARQYRTSEIAVLELAY